MKNQFIGLLLFFFTANCFAQDTVLLDKRQHYSSKKHPHRGKKFASRVKYGRELITINDSTKRLDYCYYYDKERISYGADFTFRHHSLLQIATQRDTSVWKYSKEDKGYRVEKNLGVATEFGFVKQLLPFEPMDIFYALNNNLEDTLWSIDYTTRNHRPILHTKLIPGKIYNSNEVDYLPLLQNGDTLKLLDVQQTHYYLCEPYYHVNTVSFVVAENGRVYNLKIEDGFLSEPEYLMDLLIVLIRMGPYRAAILDGRPVSVKCIVPVKYR